MAKFEVNYTAVLDCKTTIEADTEDEALDILSAMEEEGEFDYNKDCWNCEIDDVSLEKVDEK